MKTPARSFFLALLLLALGCAHVDMSQLPTPSGTALLHDVDELEGLVTQVKGSARVQASSSRGNGEAAAFIAARAPSEVHLEVLDFFGAPVQVLVSDGRTFSLYQREQGSYLHGPATASAIARLLPIHLSSEELVAILLGRAPRLQVAPGAVEVDTKAEAYRLTLVDGERRQTLWIHPTSKRVLKSVLEGPGGYSLLFEHPISTGGIPFARKVTFTDATATVVLRWNQQDVELDGTLDAGLFETHPPKGARTVEVDAAAPDAG
jgi:outer membrane lipoprotein-sorting protein